MLFFATSSFMLAFFVRFADLSSSTFSISTAYEPLQPCGCPARTSVSSSIVHPPRPHILLSSSEVHSSLTNPAYTSSSSVPSPHKRGIAFNDASLSLAFIGYSKVTWAYNWADTATNLPPMFEYVPMLWGLGDSIQSWESNAEKAIASGSTHLLAFNEPDISTQSNLAPKDAAAGYLRHIQPFAGKVNLGSPAVTNGGGHMGLAWLDNFLSECLSCVIDFIVIHWYNGGDTDAFKAYITRAYKVGGYRPVWITEFQGTGSAEEEVNFLEAVLPWLDSQEYVQRYAYFMASEGILLSGGVLSRTGKIYAST